MSDRPGDEKQLFGHWLIGAVKSHPKRIDGNLWFVLAYFLLIGWGVSFFEPPIRNSPIKVADHSALYCALAAIAIGHLCHLRADNALRP
jgi:hypothetical protein